MDSGEHRRRVTVNRFEHPFRRPDRLATLLRDAKAWAEYHLRRERPKAHHDTRLNDLELRFEPRSARATFRGIWRLVQPLLVPVSARIRSATDHPDRSVPLEVLYRVRDVHLGPIDARLAERFVEETTGRPNKRLSGDVLLVAGLLSNED